MADRPIGLDEDSSALVGAWRVLRERWWIVVVTVLACLALSVALSLTTAKQYESTSKVLLRKSPLNSAAFGTDIFPSSVDPQRDAATNVLLVKSSEVAQGVKRALQLSDSADALSSQVKVQAEENADLVDVTARDRSAKRAAQLANGFATQYVLFRQQTNRDAISQGVARLRQQLANGAVDRATGEQALQRLTALESIQTGDALIIDRATVAGGPASPKPVRDAILAGILGIALGVGIAFMLDFIDRRVKTVEDFERLYGLRALVAIPQQAFRQGSPDMRSAAFEPYRILRSSLTFASVDRRVHVLLVTSAVQGEGKTSVAVNLARAAALSGQRVVLVEADLRRPSFQRHLPMDPEAGGLTTAVVGDHAVRDLIQYGLLGLQNLGVLASGPLPPGSAEIMRSRSMGDTLRQLSSEAELIVIDAPPLLPVADAQILLGRSEIDACLLVARAYYTKREQIRRTRSILDQQRVVPIGLAVTGLRDYHTYEYYGAREEMVRRGAPDRGSSKAEDTEEPEGAEERQGSPS
ncbi:MAG: polysaccharide biosynthesis tyrosine autokinase [Actinomycetota bacterium]|nr:polysaccharide biosynthesis tyrosine autokinase [Actinomycetota bacterium]